MSKKSPFDIEAFMAEQGLEPCSRCSLPDTPMRWKVYHTPEHPCPREVITPANHLAEVPK